MRYGFVLCGMLLAMVAIAGGEDDGPRGDRLLIDGKEQPIETTPFAQYFDKHTVAWPESDLIVTHGENYTAFWEFTDSMLYLTDALILRATTTDSSGEMVPVMHEVFPGRDRVFAEWFTGYLIIPSGRREFTCKLYASWAAEHYTMFTVVSGLLRRRWSIPGSSFCDFWESQYHEYQNSQEYLTLFDEQLALASEYHRRNHSDDPTVPEPDSVGADRIIYDLRYPEYMSIIRDTVEDR